ncbi:hypothetical protein A0J61_10016 [Choanephora cucurbitarum]|uniref:AMP-binding enzyme C-terminal domain-containing protein n=1 Tax=Choanephora cucurbitarum TaxID=101091 RepID=A0A1C7MYM1_9FUNG|nr:hypothetical protein A0J61_10016 [Choanephora cucurbitarum]
MGRNSIDIIKTGGEKVSALEIERTVLSSGLNVQDVAVVGVPDPEWGQKVAAVVVLEKDKELDLLTMRNALKKQLAVYKVPALLKTVSELPKNAMGKPMLSRLVVLSILVGLSTQQCLKTFEAQINATQDAASACYYECGAQLVTRSASSEDLDQLTLFDNESSSLIANDFFQSGKPYVVNQIGMNEDNGVGCIEITSSHGLKSYALSHQTCSEANVAVCGFYGKQTKSKQTTTKSSPASISSSKSKEKKFRMDDQLYQIVQKKASTQDSMIRACHAKKASLAAVRSDTIHAITAELQRLIGPNKKLVVGSWNGDHYNLSGSQCLVMQTGNGIYPGPCTDATLALCS